MPNYTGVPQNVPGQLLPQLTAAPNLTESQSASGGPPVAPGTLPGGVPGVGNMPGGAFAGQGAYWLGHQQEAEDAFLRSHGINPDQHTAMGDWMLKQVQGLVPALFSTAFGAQGQDPSQQLADPNQLLNSIFYSGGAGGLGGNLRNYATQAMNVFQNNPVMQTNLNEDAMHQFLQTLASLNTYGMNPYMGQAYSNAFDARMNQQRIAARNAMFGGQPIPSLWDFLNQAGQPGFQSYGLPGQQRATPPVTNPGMAGP